MNELGQMMADAGCDAEQISELCRLYESGDLQTVVRKLRRHRCDLMDKLHEDQRVVDCLDYFLRAIKQRSGRI